MIENIEHFKDMLEKEKESILKELQTVGRKNPVDPSDWEAVGPEINRDRADETEVADNIEQYENNSAILEQLEKQLGNVKAALEKIAGGTYGLCEVSGEPIETDRLEANPSARTCKLHMNS